MRFAWALWDILQLDLFFPFRLDRVNRLSKQLKESRLI